MVFSRNVETEVGASLARILGIAVLSKHDRYLAGRSKKEMFDELKERIWRKLNTWSSKQLSQVGWAVLLKADGNTEGVQQAKEIQDPLDQDLTIGSGPMTRGRLKRMQETTQAQSNIVFANGIKSQLEAQYVSLISLIQAQGDPK
ncbi:UNVERIFIED_CONTAM: hypothetical protein Slati_2702000 [Sesamum latifolium]|uniref:Uncharacterized protein n=1 Tax=Sesamum latifolium TaxID=2727402 RepID=A0AAW2VVS4_9LAMI